MSSSSPITMVQQTNESPATVTSSETGDIKLCSDPNVDKTNIKAAFLTDREKEESSSSVTSPIVDDAISTRIMQDARREVGANIENPVKPSISDEIPSTLSNNINVIIANGDNEATSCDPSVLESQNQNQDLCVNNAKEKDICKRQSLDYDNSKTIGISSIHGDSIRETWISSLSFISRNYSQRNQLVTAPKLWLKRKDIYKIYITGLLSMKRGTAFSLLSMLLSMIIQLYPSCPRFGTNLACMSLILYADEKQRDRSSVFFAVYCLLCIASILMDFDWLSSCYDIASLDQTADNNNKTYNYATSLGCIGLPLVGKVSWWAILMNIPIKAVMMFMTVRRSKSGQGLLWAIWKRLNFFFPPCTTRNPKDISGAIQTRVIAIEWIEFICSISMLLLTIYVYIQLAWSVLFTYPAPLIPLKVIMLIKGLVGLLVYASCMKNTNLLAFFSEFGCRPSCKNIRDGKTVPGSSIGTQRKVNVDGDFLCFNTFTKVLDLMVGVVVWIQVIWVISHMGVWKSEPKAIRVVLGGIIVLQLITDFLVVILGIVVIRLVKLMRYQNLMKFRQNGFGVRTGPSAAPARLSVYIGSDMEPKHKRDSSNHGPENENNSHPDRLVSSIEDLST